MPSKPTKTLEETKPPRIVPVHPKLEAALYDRHTKPMIVPGSQFDTSWLQVAQQLLHMTDRQRQLEGKGNMRHYCDSILKNLNKVRGKGFGKLKLEITRIKEEWG